MAPFDPYHIWLGIPAEEQPPSHYRLLGIPDLESNPDVIDSAAEQRTIYLRTFQTGDQAALAEQLLNEVSAARICLLDGKAKARYDKRLKAELESAAGSAALANISLAAESGSQRGRGLRSSAPPTWYKTPWAAAGGGAVVMLLLMLLFWPGGSKPTASKTLPAKAAVAPLLAVAPFDAAEAKAHQQAWSKYLGVPVEYTNSIGMKFMLIPPGEFMMGSPESEEGRREDELPHHVRLTRPFYLGSVEVTQEQYLKVMGTNPSSSKGDQQPVEEVSWQATAGFLHLLSSLPKERRGEKMYRLPTEAEWEYACRAGTTSRFSFGSSIDKFPEYSWPVKDLPKASKTPRPVGKKFPNPWKLYDLYANVSEWCQDYYGDYPSLPVVDPKGPLTGAARVRRGGGHMHRIVDCRSASRLTYAAKGNENLVGNENLGFRVVLEIPVRAQPNTSTAETKSLPPSLTKRLVTRPPFRDNIKDVILALSFDGDEVVTQEGKMCLKDSSPLGNIVHTNSAAFVSTPTGEGLVFDGFDDTVLVKNFRSQITQKKEGLTVACLLKTTKPGYVLDIGADGQQLSLTTDFQFMPGGTNPWIVRNEELSPQLDQWLLLVGTWDGIKVNTYVNGEIYRSRNGRVQGPISDRSFPSGDSTLVIGQQHKSYRRTGRGFGGVLDELLFFKRALSAAEVKALYEFEKP